MKTASTFIFDPLYADTGLITFNDGNKICPKQNLVPGKLYRIRPDKRAAMKDPDSGTLKEVEYVYFLESGWTRFSENRSMYLGHPDQEKPVDIVVMFVDHVNFGHPNQLTTATMTVKLPVNRSDHYPHYVEKHIPLTSGQKVLWNGTLRTIILGDFEECNPR